MACVMIAGNGGRSGIITAACLLSWVLRAASPAAVEFNRDVRPLLSDRCFSCHGPDRASRTNALRLDQESSAKADLGQGRFGLVPGDPARSEVFRRITSTDPAQRMPPAYLGRDKLPEAETEILRRWIEQGAVYQQHWSFLPPQRPALPEVREKSWPRNPIDAFLLARLEREGLRHAEIGRAHV